MPKTGNSDAACAITGLLEKTRSAGMVLFMQPRITITDFIPTRHEDDGCPKRIDIQSRNNKGSTPVNWTSWALTCPPPPQEYFTYDNDNDNDTYASFLPPLSVALNGSQVQQGGILMP